MNDPKSKKRLTMMPEVLPAPAVVTTGSVRRRTLARLRVLAALGAASLVSGCDGESPYGVVDPIPAPSCFSSTLPSVTARFTTAADLADDAGALDAGAAGTGERLVTIDLTSDEPNFELDAFQTDDPLASVVSTSQRAGGARAIVRITGERTVRFQATASCTSGGGRFTVAVSVTADTVSAVVN